MSAFKNLFKWNIVTFLYKIEKATRERHEYDNQDAKYMQEQQDGMKRERRIEVSLALLFRSMINTIEQSQNEAKLIKSITFVVKPDVSQFVVPVSIGIPHCKVEKVSSDTFKLGLEDDEI
jgi:hypothetical protein